MNDSPKVAATSRLFSLLPELGDELMAAYPDAKINPGGVSMSEDGLIEFLDGYQVVVAGIERYTDRVLAALPELEVIACCSAGVDHLDPDLLQKHAVRMGWIPGVNKYAVSELALSFMISAVRHLNSATAAIREGEWKPRLGWQLRGRTVGIHGCGNIGKELVKLLQPFDVEILACDRVDYPEFYETYGVRPVGPDELWAESEVLSIHLPRNSTTIGLYNEAALDQLRPGMYLINTARGRIVDEQALKERLKDGRIAGAAFDVFDVEPVTDDELIALPNFLATPHLGAGTREAWFAMARAGMRGITENAIPEAGVYPFD